jgi:hypothetical protein
VEALDNGPSQEHDLNDIDLALIPQVEENQEQIDLVLNQLTVMHQVLLIGLPKVGKQDQHAQNLEHVYHFLALRILYSELFVKLLSVFLWLQAKDILSHLHEFFLLHLEAENEILVADLLHDFVDHKWGAEQFVNDLTDELGRV